MKTVLAILALLIAMPFLYFGAYRAMLICVKCEVDLDRGIIGAEKQNYWFGGRVSDAFFAPANAFDRQLQPDNWHEAQLVKSSEPNH